MSVTVEQARKNKRLAWLIVGASGTVTLVLAALLLGWAGRQASRWMAAQQQEFRQGLDEGQRDHVDREKIFAPEPSAQSDVPQPVAAGPAPPNSARPVGSPAAWVGADDYPPSALRNGWEGGVRVTVRVDRAGTPMGCAVRASSGHWSLDNATCAAMLNHGRFDIAPTGPRERYWTSPVIRWAMPDERTTTARKSAATD